MKILSKYKIRFVAFLMTVLMVLSMIPSAGIVKASTQDEGVEEEIWLQENCIDLVFETGAPVKFLETSLLMQFSKLTEGYSFGDYIIHGAKIGDYFKNITWDSKYDDYLQDEWIIGYYTDDGIDDGVTYDNFVQINSTKTYTLSELYDFVVDFNLFPGGVTVDYEPANHCKMIAIRPVLKKNYELTGKELNNPEPDYIINISGDYKNPIVLPYSDYLDNATEIWTKNWQFDLFEGQKISDLISSIGYCDEGDAPNDGWTLEYWDEKKGENVFVNKYDTISDFIKVKFNKSEFDYGFYNFYPNVVENGDGGNYYGGDYNYIKLNDDSYGWVDAEGNPVDLDEADLHSRDTVVNIWANPSEAFDLLVTAHNNHASCVETDHAKVDIGTLNICCDPGTSGCVIPEDISVDILRLTYMTESEGSYTYSVPDKKMGMTENGWLYLLHNEGGNIVVNGNVSEVQLGDYNRYDEIGNALHNGQTSVNGDVNVITWYKETADSASDTYTSSDVSNGKSESEHFSYYAGDFSINGNVDEIRAREYFKYAKDNYSGFALKALVKDYATEEETTVIESGSFKPEILGACLEIYSFGEWIEEFKSALDVYQCYYYERGGYSWSHWLENSVNGAVIGAPEDIFDIDEATHLPDVDFTNSYIDIYGTDSNGITFTFEPGEEPENISVLSGKVIVNGNLNRLSFEDKTKFWQGIDCVDIAINGNVNDIYSVGVGKSVNLSVTGSISNAVVGATLKAADEWNEVWFCKKSTDYSAVITAGNFNSNIFFVDTDEAVENKISYRVDTPLSDLESASGLTDESKVIGEGDEAIEKGVNTFLTSTTIDAATQTDVVSASGWGEECIVDANVIDVEISVINKAKWKYALGEIIHETTNPIKYSIEWDNDNNLEYKVVRIHDGVCELLEGTTISEEGILSFESDKFSKFVIVSHSNETTHTHSFVEVPAVAATCTTAGNNKYYTCSGCELVFKEDQETITTVEAETLEALGHTPVTDSGYDSTYDSTGLTDGSHCEVCGEVIVEQTVIPQKTRPQPQPDPQPQPQPQPEPVVPPVAETPTENTPVVEVKPDGSTTTTIKNEDGSVVAKTESPNGTVETKTETPDGTVETITEKPNGTVVTKTENPDGSSEEITVTKNGQVTTVDTAVDGSQVKTVEKTQTNAAGKTCDVVTVTKYDAEGKKTGSEKTTTIEKAEKNTSVTVSVTKDENGKNKSVTADVDVKPSNTKKITISSNTLSQIVEAAGTKSVDITMDVFGKSSSKKPAYTVKVNSKAIKAGNTLKMYAVKNGKFVIVDNKTYDVKDNGSVSLNVSNTSGTYKLTDPAEAKAIVKKIAAEIKPAKTTTNVKVGKKDTMKLSKSYATESIKSITYSTGNKKVATVDKNGKITSKKKGSATITASVVLKDGTKKTIKMKVNVK